MTDEIDKACPFCGGKVDPAGWLRNDGVRGPECEKCGATAHTIALWNTRVDDIERRRVPEGWKVVPVEPDEQMVNAAVRCVQVAEGKMNRSVLAYILSVGIAAAPEPDDD